MIVMAAVLAACGTNGTSGPPDSRPGEICECFTEIGCRSGQAVHSGTGEIPCDEWYAGFCEDYGGHACTAGCYVESVVGSESPRLSYAPSAVFCLETPAAQLGDSCANDCLPTRAQVATDGTVTQQYLQCGGTTTAMCVAAPPPVIDNYLAPCPNAAARWGGPGANGITGASDDGFAFTYVCLLAWDPATATTASGATIQCVGDWDCPDGSLCDDHVAQIPADYFGPIAVCRPGGPRGEPIDPARL